jgi:hypothetical protein
MQDRHVENHRQEGQHDGDEDNPTVSRREADDIIYQNRVAWAHINTYVWISMIIAKFGYPNG